ncbi:MAG TPA: glycosyltransferase [Acidimicrobiales bacterium]|nr:glycosyltransferase [Acidimicrobiales bacterium]
MRRLAVLSLHTSPLAQPGAGDSGGMNVYVRELVSALAQAGVAADVYTRRWADDQPEVVDVEPGFRVVHVDAGPAGLPKEALPEIVDDFADGVLEHLLTSDNDMGVDALHANYWLSGIAAHRLKHELDLPLVSTFHTLARVKAETGDPEPQRRVDAETLVIGCSDAILANGPAEASQLVSLYGAAPERVEIVPPGVVHAFFSPGDRTGARAALGHLGPFDGPVLLFVGRIQPLKGLDVAVRALAELDDPRAVLVVVGGASGRDGRSEIERVEKLAAEVGVSDRVRFAAPQPHYMLSTFYRAADVVLVPSRSESFGLVALEAAACGTPVVAAAVGGLRTLVEHGRTGFLVEGRDPTVFAAYTDEVLSTPGLGDELAAQAAHRARDYTWSTAAGRLRRIYADLTTRSRVTCDS